MKFQNYLICTASGEIFRGLFVSLAFAIGIWYDMKMKKASPGTATGHCVFTCGKQAERWDS
ncbi:hypothetical protein NSB25_02340 [Acetatifactor muris]|uniref:hypothetical protein n=1 Tax=Acetatifactor muris TaxID=879566 RepID=UPI000CD2B31C|nr:hypothetical protein [Acetatifactor muris]MCR2046117.1 hypothetical protein [Acetatifactor muris]